MTNNEAELREQIDELVKDAYLAGWHDTAPTYENPEIAKSVNQIIHLITEQTMKAQQLTQICGKPIDEVVMILNALEIERITDIKFTMSNLDELRTKLMEDMRIANEKAVNRVFEQALKPHHKAEE